MTGTVFDSKSSFFKTYFEKALPYEQYVQTGNPAQVERWHAFERELEVKGDQRALIESFKRRMPVLVMSGIWCGDCMRQGPMLHRIARCSGEIDLRFIDNNQNPELRDELRIAGGARVPVVVAFSEDYFEIGRSADRTLSHYRAKARRELGATCDSGLVIGGDNELQTELGEWVEFFEHMQLILRLSPFLRARYQD